MRIGEVAQRALHFADELVEHRPDGGENLLQVGGLGGVALHVLGLGEGELHFFGQGAGEVIAAHWNGALPNDPLAVGNDQVGVVRANVEGDDATFLAAFVAGAGEGTFVSLNRFLLVTALGSGWGTARADRPLGQNIVGDKVAQGQGRHLHHMDFDFHVPKMLQRPIDHVALHREQTDLRLHGEAVRHLAGDDLLIIPNHFLQREGDLLLGLEADDVGDFLFLDRRQLDEACQAALTGYADRYHVAAEGIARQEFFQGLAHQLVGIGIGLAQDLRMLDVIEGGGRRLTVDIHEANGLESTLTHVNAPNARLFCHVSCLPTAAKEYSRPAAKTEKSKQRLH